MTCSIWFSQDPDIRWSTQNVRYSWLVDRVVDRMRPEEEALRERFRVSEAINLLALDDLRDEDESMWKRAIEVLSEVVDDIVERRLPRDLDEERRDSLCAEYSALQQMIRQHRAGGPFTDGV